MGTKMVRLEEDVYEQISSHKREDETFSEAVERLIGSPSLLSLAGILSDEDAQSVREAVADADERATDDVDDLVERFGDADE
jgi:predicted CopG family antitoxin